VGGKAPSGALDGARIDEVHRLDTLPGVAARASKAGLKNPDFVVFATRAGRSTVFAVDAKFSVETARPVQISAETTTQLFQTDARLSAMLPDPHPDARFVDGIFLSPDYSLTHEMFKHKVGHRRLTVSPDAVMLVSTSARQLFGDVTEDAIIERLCRIDALPFPVWESLLAGQYYLRLERAIVGIVADERKPLLGTLEAETTTADLVARLENRASGAESAWQLIRGWDGDVETIRRQRQAMHQVIGSPLSSNELRDLSDKVMDRMGLDRRPSRNQVRKALSGRFTSDVLGRVGVILPPVEDFAVELERVAAVAREVNERYAETMCETLEDIIGGLSEAQS
jgi:hypothetical protein